MSVRPDLNTYEWRIIRAKLRKKRLPCAICGGEIDYNAPPKSKWSFAVDHIIPPGRGGDHSMIQPAHTSCNASKGNRIDAKHSRRSRDW